MPKSMSFTSAHIKPYGFRAAVYVLFVALSVVFTMATALSVADFLKLLFEPSADAAVAAGADGSGTLLSQALQGLYNTLIVFGPRKALLWFSLIVFLLYAFKNVFTYLAAVQIAVIRTRVVRDIRDDLFRQAMRLPVSYYDIHRQGDVLSRFSNDVVEYDENILGSISMLAIAVVSIVLYLLMLLYINVKLTLVVLVALPVVAVVISGISHNLKRKSKDLQERNSFLMTLIQETVEGLKVVKAYTAIPFCNDRFRRYNADYNRRRTRMYRRIYLASPVSDTLGNIIVILILLFGSWLVFNHDAGLTPELFVSYIMMFVLVIPPVKDLSTAIAQIKKGRACADRIAEFATAENDRCEPPELKIVTRGDGSDAQPAGVAFSHVGFAYRKGVEVLHDVSFEIPVGTTLALVGPSGSGKSTVADLLLGLYRPTEGEITLAEGRCGAPRIAVVPQETTLFNDTVANNIAFGGDGCGCDSGGRPLPEVVAAAKLADADGFVSRLAEGYGTNVGDGGSLLSGGQRQRLALARALYTDPDILILDEATSALDTESERQVQKALDQAMRGRTVLVVAHRLSTVRHADQILFLENGRVVERGTHRELMALGGRYHHLVALQQIK